MWCLTVRQPFASLIVRGVKDFEVRGWAPAHRGLLGVHSARAYPSWADVELAASLLPGPVDLDWLLAWALAEPRGVVLGSVQLLGIEALPSSSPWAAFGSWLWRLDSPVAWVRPVRAVGRLGLWPLGAPVVSPSQLSLFAS